jgi:hypothetical protein
MADEPKMVVFCGGCSLPLDENPNAALGTQPPCPECGSRTRYMRTVPNRGHVLMSSTVRKKPGEKRSPIEERHGDIVSSDGRWLRIHRIIDRRHNRYYEKVHDHETREILREVNEPLTDHRGRGDAKPRSPRLPTT